MTGTPELPQSQTPLAWIPADIVRQVAINQLILSGCLAVRSCVPYQRPYHKTDTFFAFLHVFLAGVAMGCASVSL